MLLESDRIFELTLEYTPLRESAVTQPKDDGGGEGHRHA
jgi:hypothetical protein